HVRRFSGGAPVADERDEVLFAAGQEPVVEDDRSHRLVPALTVDDDRTFAAEPHAHRRVVADADVPPRVRVGGAPHGLAETRRRRAGGASGRASDSRGRSARSGGSSRGAPGRRPSPGAPAAHVAGTIRRAWSAAQRAYSPSRRSDRPGRGGARAWRGFPALSP